MDIALLLLRLLLAAVLLAHAAQKSFGWFQGPGLTKQAGLFESLGLRPGRVMVLAAAVSEAGAGLLLALGLLTPLAALAAAGTMLVAAVAMTTHSGKVWNVAGGGEFPFVLAFVAATLGFAGPGAYSFDALLAHDVSFFARLAEPATATGLVVVVVALLAAVPFAFLQRRSRSAAATA